MRISNETTIYLINGYPYTLFNDGNKAWWKAGSYVQDIVMKDKMTVKKATDEIKDICNKLLMDDGMKVCSVSPIYIESISGRSNCINVEIVLNEGNHINRQDVFMSYCRWSSMNGMCDIYAYESDCGILIHVADKRYEREPYPSSCDYIKYANDGEKLLQVARERNKDLESIQRTKIGLPHDGESFSFSDYEGAYLKLVELRDMGYNVTQCAIDELKGDAGV